MKFRCCPRPSNIPSCTSDVAPKKFTGIPDLKSEIFLEKWWSSMEKRHFNRLVSAFVGALQQIVDHAPDNASEALPLCTFLSTLNDINKSHKLIPHDKFYLKNLDSKVDMTRDFTKWAFSVSSFIGLCIKTLKRIPLSERHFIFAVVNLNLLPNSKFTYNLFFKIFCALY